MTRFASMALVLLVGCAPFRSVAVPTGGEHHAPYRGHVTVSATRDPPGGREVGVVEVTGGATIDEVIPEVIARVAQLGGNYARIDHIATRYQWVSQPVTQSYQCGSFRFPTYCQRTYMQTQEVATMRATGRAFRVGLP
ncbi:MAG: hypothetical protein U0326_39050 [Polyangiales bacterium]